jgi:hypothetical protein
MPLLVNEEMPVQTEVRAESEVRAEMDECVTRKVTNGDAGLYERILELPVPVVLFTLWLSGVALIALCTLPLYQLLWALLKTLADI